MALRFSVDDRRCGSGGSTADGGALLHALAVAVGGSNACVVAPDHTAECWAYNVEGQDGVGSTAVTNEPAAVSGLTGVSAIASSGITSCAILSDGTEECWGDNSEGELGVGNITGPDTCALPCAKAPVAVPGLSTVTAMAMGGNHTCALTGGTVECWGANFRGQLSNGTMTGPDTSSGGEPCNPTPAAVSGVTGATAIGAGDTLAAAVSRVGRDPLAGSSDA